MSFNNLNRNHELGSDEDRRRATPSPRTNQQQQDQSFFSTITQVLNDFNIANIQQLPSNAPDVLFSGFIGNQIPPFSITVDRTNILPNGRQQPTAGGTAPAPGLIFSLDNLPNALREIVERTMQSAQAPVVRATDEAIRHLKVMDPEDLPEDNKKCAICYEDFDQPVYHRKPFVNLKERFEDIESDPPISMLVSPTTQIYAEYVKNPKNTSAPSTAENEASRESGFSQPEHIPVQMPCKHIFGRSCLVEWLKQNVSCPLCRQEIEAEQLNPTVSMERSLIINRVNVPSNLSSLSDNLMDDPQILFPVNSSTTRTRNNQRNPLLMAPSFIDGIFNNMTSTFSNLRTQSPATDGGGNDS